MGKHHSSLKPCRFHSIQFDFFYQDGFFFLSSKPSSEERPHSEVVEDLFRELIRLSAAVGQSEEGECDPGVVPEQEGEEDEEVPPLVAVTQDVHGTRQESEKNHNCIIPTQTPNTI